jgi:antagonist of KipI
MNNQIIHIEQCGFLTTIQDGGRTNYLKYGVSKGGAMDVYSMQLANLLVGNELTAPVLELTQSPHQFTFLQNTLVAFAGGGLQPQINETELSLFQIHLINAGTVLQFKKQLPGFRLYMAVAGGFAGDEFLNSYSTDLLVKAGGFEGRPLKKGDTVLLQNKLTDFQLNLYKVLQSGAAIKFNWEIINFQYNTIRVIKGAEWDYLTADAKEIIINKSFSISPQSSRMGCRLKCEGISTHNLYNIISSPVTQGTVQLTSSGELIVLMADAQTVGGYPRVLQVIAADIPILAQKKPGDAIQFEMVSLLEAEGALLQQQLRIVNYQKMIKNMNNK